MFISGNGIQLKSTLLQKTATAVFLPFLFSFSLYSQQLIINEVSQGPNGSKEYVELLVAGTPSCSSIPCMDLRGYYIDDNNGDIASGAGTGIAQGCVRFRNTSFWSCIPIGTLIVIYNDIDQNTNIPAQDLTMTDGNFRLVIPANNCTLLETNLDFPSLASSGFPASGFTSCGDWNTLAMANSDDSFQTVDESGNSMFSVSWGNNTNNPTIYFSGTSSAMVAYMANTVDNNPNNQANWIRDPVAGNETPGIPNNTANAVWIASMNNSTGGLTVSVNSETICSGASVTLTATGADNYVWSTGATTASISQSPAAATSYTVTGTSAGCSGTATSTITVNPAPLAHFGADKLTSCREFCPNFSDSSTIAGSSIASWAWDFGDGTSADVASPQHCYTNVGNYTVTLTVVSDSGCTTSVTYTDYISIVEPPVADFSYPETPVSSVEPDVTFVNGSTNATLWHWDFGDRNDTASSNEKNPVHIYENHGDYCAVLIAGNILGCTDTMEHCFKVEPYYTFYIPNSFTPNNDGKNDEFYGVGDNILECEMIIFDRWGIEMFHTENYDEHWNGRINNVKGKCMQDTYVYLITVKDVNLKMHQYKGSFTLIRE